MNRDLFGCLYLEHPKFHGYHCQHSIINEWVQYLLFHGLLEKEIVKNDLESK